MSHHFSPLELPACEILSGYSRKELFEEEDEVYIQAISAPAAIKPHSGMAIVEGPTIDLQEHCLPPHITKKAVQQPTDIEIINH